MKKINWKRLIIITIITFLVGSFFSFFTMNNMSAFKELEKPINVPTIIFSIVWSILYLLMSISCYLITQKGIKMILDNTRNYKNKEKYNFKNYFIICFHIYNYKVNYFIWNATLL